MTFARPVAGIGLITGGSAILYAVAHGATFASLGVIVADGVAVLAMLGGVTLLWFAAHYR